MHAIAPKSFRFALEAGVATITFTRPDRLNALTFEIYRELAETFEQLNAHEEVRSVLLTGEGRAFCSGGDVEDIIGELLSPPSPSLPQGGGSPLSPQVALARDMQGLVAFTRATGRLIAAIRKLRRPVIAAVHGVAVGAGAVIALACDMRICSEKAKFGFVFPQVGLCGADMGAAYLLPRVVGLGHASELLFTGDIIGAEHALRIGLANRVVPLEGCLAEATKLAQRLASGPAFAHAMTKQMLESEHTMSLDAAIEAEAQVQAICMQHPDFRTAHDAWQNKTAPTFKGASVPFQAKP